MPFTGVFVVGTWSVIATVGYRSEMLKPTASEALISTLPNRVEGAGARAQVDLVLLSHRRGLEGRLLMGLQDRDKNV